MNEFELIRRLTADLPTDRSVVRGVGDDCAVLDLGIPGRHVLFKTDAVVEGVHFSHTDPPEKVGHKALARCLSDFAAMAGTPSTALVTLGLPRNHDLAWVDAAYAGLRSTAKRHGVSIVGGETTTNPGGRLFSIALLGTVAAGKAVLRSGARVGDAIFVSGELGGSLTGRHLEFEPRLTEARWIAERFEVRSMIDVSDGLAGDLHHVLAASHVGAELLTSAIPISRAARQAAKAESSAKPPVLAALTDGEDFELLFTVPSQQAVPLLDGWKQQFRSVRLSCIGKITEAKGLRLRDRDGVKEFKGHGYVHFEKP